jgi:hypothetical protein
LSIAAFVVAGLLAMTSLPALAQSGNRSEFPNRAGSQTSSPAGSDRRPAQQAPLALQGYCPVSLLQMRKWVKGDPAQRLVHDGRTDRAALQSYLATLSAADRAAETSHAGKLAFWINAYNALTIHGILKEYPTSSIRNHTAAVVGYNIWDDLLLPVGNQQYSLNQIEHEILCKMGEPRIHFAIVCASVGCPRLLNNAYTPARLEEQLSANTRDFFSREQNFQVDIARRRVRVSAILDWFGEDFGPTPQNGLASLAQYLPDGAARQLVASEDFTVSFLDYDWGLNEQ